MSGQKVKKLLKRSRSLLKKVTHMCATSGKAVKCIATKQIFVRSMIHPKLWVADVIQLPAPFIPDVDVMAALMLFLLACANMLRAHEEYLTWDVVKLLLWEFLRLGPRTCRHYNHQRWPPAAPPHLVRRCLSCYRCPAAGHYTNSAAAAASAQVVAAAAASGCNGLWLW